jgi:hypothetical protein
VVQARASLGEELAHCGVGTERLEQLDVAVADIEQDSLDALLGDRLAVNERHPEHVAVALERFVDVVDGDADVVDRGQHAAGGY